MSAQCVVETRLAASETWQAASLPLPGKGTSSLVPPKGQETLGFRRLRAAVLGAFFRSLLQRVQIHQQILNLLVAQFGSKCGHLAAAIADDFTHAVVVRG